MPFICEKNHNCCNYQYYDSALDIEDTCDHLIEVDYVVHAKWVTHNADNPFTIFGECSHCRFEQSVSENLKFCPNCGAKMDLEKD